ACSERGANRGHGVRGRQQALLIETGTRAAIKSENASGVGTWSSCAGQAIVVEPASPPFIVPPRRSCRLSSDGAPTLPATTCATLANCGSQRRQYSALLLGLSIGYTQRRETPMVVERRTFMAAAAAAAAYGGDGAAEGRWNSPAPVRYPDPDLKVIAPRFERMILGLTAIERIGTGFRFTEGPVWFGDTRQLLFSDIPNDRIMRWDEETGAVSVFRRPSNYANGNTRDRQGRLVTCEHDTQRLTRTEYD